MKNLLVKDFLCSQHVYWATSRASSDLLWLVVLPKACAAVAEFDRRASADAATPPNLRWCATHGDLFDTWLGLFSLKKPPDGTRGAKGVAGCAYPQALSDDLFTVWAHARGSPDSTRLDLT